MWRPADPGTHLSEYSDDGKVIQRKLQINMGDAQVGQKLDCKREVVEIEPYGGKPQDADDRQTLPAYFMPPDNGSFGEPVQVMIGVSKCDEAHHDEPGMGREHLP